MHWCVGASCSISFFFHTLLSLFPHSCTYLSVALIIFFPSPFPSSLPHPFFQLCPLLSVCFFPFIAFYFLPSRLSLPLFSFFPFPVLNPPPALPFLIFCLILLHLFPLVLLVMCSFLFLVQVLFFCMFPYFVHISVNVDFGWNIQC